MQNKKILFGIGALALFILGGGYILINPPATGKTPPVQNTADSSGQKPSQPAVAQNSAPQTPYTLAEVAKHNSQSSCWTAVGGNVYDLTSFISQHPGGADAIMSLCGIDGSAAFTNQHGNLNKNRRPQKELAGLEIGILK